MFRVRIRPSLGCLALAALTCLCVPASAQLEVPDFFPDSWYRIAFDRYGEKVEGDGHGYNGGTWYYYPQTGWYRQWFYNGPYDPDRKGELYYKAYIMPGPEPNRSSDIEMEFNWASPEWSALGLDHPPLPGDAPTAGDEDVYIEKQGFHSTFGVWGFQSIEPNRGITVRDYNPEWTCIAIRGKNVRVYRWAIHDCVPKDEAQGAWCNDDTGDCYMGYEQDGEPSYTWLGAGSSCQSCLTKPTTSLDFGDAPDPSYPTLMSHNGARHTLVAGIFLGRTVDAEADGQPNTGATGDGDDEDGVTFTSALEPGKTASLDVTASVQGYLNAWIDFDGNGSFSGADEQIFNDRLLGLGANSLTFAVPATAAEGVTYARFRFNTRGLLGHSGPAADGEVEDYRVSILTGFEPQAVSGLTAALANQPPSLIHSADPFLFSGFATPSSFGLHQLAADDCQLEAGRPVTGIHWWGSFEGWSQPHLPPEMPLAFHIAVWSDVPDGQPNNPSTFSHPGTLLWETYLVDWSWALAGRQQDGGAGETGPMCFQFSHTLSQDEWLYPTSADAFCWVSIAAVYEIDETQVEYPWGWLSRTHQAGAPATVIQEVSPVDLAPWPPTPGAQWRSGTPLDDGTKLPWDLAFQLTTFVSPYGGTGGPGKLDATQ